MQIIFFAPQKSVNPFASLASREARKNFHLGLCTTS
jgi:hypothetical protein